MENTNIIDKKGRERSTPYPGISLDVAVEMIEELKKSLGKGPFARESIARALGHKDLTGPASRKIAALAHYGLLNRTGDVYSTSSLTEDILHPISEESKRLAIIEAAKYPKLFYKLFEQYQNQSLPRMLDNILMREGVGSTVAKEVASIFTKTLEYAGLLQNGVVVSPSVNNLAVEDSKDKTLGVDTKLFESSDLAETQIEFKKDFQWTDSGKGWIVSIKSQKPLTSKVKKMLIDVSDLLDNEELA